MNLDFGARALATRNRKRQQFNERIGRLRRSIARTGLQLPGVMASPPTITAPSTTSAVTGTFFQLYASGIATTNFARYTLLRGAWRPAGAGFPLYNYAMTDAVTRGTAPFDTLALRNSNKYDNPNNSYVRFMCTAADLEINFVGSATVSAGGFRVKVDGQYVQVGAFTSGVNSPAGGHYVRLTWGDGTAANRQPRLYEIEGLQQFKFGGIKCAPIDPPYPAPVVDGLRGMVHGDSFTTDTGVTQAALHPGLSGLIPALLGQPNMIASGIGSTGFNWNGSGYNNFLQWVDLDVIPFAPDFIVELGGLNDNQGMVNAGTGAAYLQPFVEQWLAQVIGALPDVLIFMTGPMVPGTSTTGYGLLRDAKKAAAAKYPNNVVFIDNVAEEWVTGTGKVSAPTGAGHADWITGGDTGSDGTHPTNMGHTYVATRICRGIATALAAV